jgi:hypothetical protein
MRGHEDKRFVKLLRAWRVDVMESGVMREVKLRRLPKRVRLRLKQQRARQRRLRHG